MPAIIIREEFTRWSQGRQVPVWKMWLTVYPFRFLGVDRIICAVDVDLNQGETMKFVKSHGCIGEKPRVVQENNKKYFIKNVENAKEMVGRMAETWSASLSGASGGIEFRPGRENDQTPRFRVPEDANENTLCPEIGPGELEIPLRYCLLYLNHDLVESRLKRCRVLASPVDLEALARKILSDGEGETVGAPGISNNEVNDDAAYSGESSGENSGFNVDATNKVTEIKNILSLIYSGEWIERHQTTLLSNGPAQIMHIQQLHKEMAKLHTDTQRAEAFPKLFNQDALGGMKQQECAICFRTDVEKSLMKPTDQICGRTYKPAPPPKISIDGLKSLWRIARKSNTCWARLKRSFRQLFKKQITLGHGIEEWMRAMCESLQESREELIERGKQWIKARGPVQQEMESKVANLPVCSGYNHASDFPGKCPHYLKVDALSDNFLTKKREICYGLQ